MTVLNMSLKIYAIVTSAYCTVAMVTSAHCTVAMVTSAYFMVAMAIIARALDVVTTLQT